MSVKINGLIEIYSELSASPVDWLLANVNDKIRIEIPFEVSRYSLASSSNPIIVNLTDGVIGVGWAKSTNNAFKGMEVGDSIVWGNYVTSTVFETKTIIQKISDNLVQFDAYFTTVPPTPDDFSSEQSIFSLEKDITAIKYRFNFIENSEALNFLSKVDSEENLLINELVDASDLSVLPMDWTGTLPHQIGSATIQGVAILTTPYYANQFKLIHYTYITPFMLASQRADLISGVSPSYFTNAKCLKYVYNIKALFVYTNPSEYEELTVSSVLGNTGWYDEKFNNIPTNYSVEDLIYKQMPSTTVISALELSSGLTQVNFTIKNLTDTPFVNGATKFVLGFIKVPYNDTEYTANGKNMETNFVFDRALQTVGSVAVNGDKFGTDMQVLKTITTETQRTTGASNTFVGGMERAIRTTAQYALSLGLVYSAIGQLRDGMQYIIDLNKEMTNIQLVTGSSDAEIANLAKGYNTLAKEMGATTLEVAKGSVEFIRQGKTAEETANNLVSELKSAPMTEIFKETEKQKISKKVTTPKVH